MFRSGLTEAPEVQMNAIPNTGRLYGYGTP